LGQNNRRDVVGRGDLQIPIIIVKDVCIHLQRVVEEFSVRSRFIGVQIFGIDVCGCVDRIIEAAVDPIVCAGRLEKALARMQAFKTS
jgi:hypothetical protein